MNEDIAFMKNPDLWPAWPFCPLVNREEESNSPRKFGFLYNESLYGAHTAPIVYYGSIYDSKLIRGENIIYETFEELAKVWRVD